MTRRQTLAAVVVLLLVLIIAVTAVMRRGSRGDVSPLTGERESAAVEAIGEAAIKVILESRDVGGDFDSLTDFCQRVDQQKVNKKVFESLIKAGAMDRSALMSVRRPGAPEGGRAFGLRQPETSAIGSNEGRLRSFRQDKRPFQ